MTKIKPGDQIICCFKEDKLVSPYSSWDKEIDLSVLSLDDENTGCFVYVPDYLFINNTLEINQYNYKALDIPPKYIGCFCLYVSFAYVSRVGKRLDGETCTKCQEFHHQAESNQNDGSFMCWVCRNYKFYK